MSVELGNCLEIYVACPSPSIKPDYMTFQHYPVQVLKLTVRGTRYLLTKA